MPSEPNANAQAKVLQSRALRTLIVVVVLGAMLLGIKWYQANKSDIGNVVGGPVNSIGMIEAIRYGDDGDHVVVFTDKGQKIEQKAIKSGSRDQNPVWQPDGNRIFFVSDRDGKSYQLYRWKPAADVEPEARSLGSLGKSNPTFAVGETDANAPMLIVSGGFVTQFDPKDLKGHQVLPPTSGSETVTSQEEGGGGESQFTGVYGDLGDRFRIARWEKGEDAIVAVMGSDRGEVLIYQELTKAGDKPKLPLPIVYGGHIDFDISPTDGAVVFTVQNFIYPPKAKPPADQRIRHCVAIWHPDGKPLQMLIPSRDDSACFGSPAISPAGDKVLLVEGSYDTASESLQSKVLVTMPTEGNAAAGLARLIEGEVYEPTWGNKGELIAYAKVGANKSRGIYIALPDGSAEHVVSGDTGNYGHPLVSPQTKS